MFNKIVIILAFFVCALRPANAQVVINEFVVDASPEWVEFYNASSSAEYLTSYWIDDDTDFNSDSGSTGKKPLTNITIASISYPFIDVSSMFNNSGDTVVLFDSSGSVVDQYSYSANPGDSISIGRNPDQSGSFTLLSSTTKSAANSAPAPSSTPTPTQTPTPGQTHTPIPTNTPVPTKLATKTPTPTKKISPTPTPSPPAGGSPTPQSEVLGLVDDESASQAASPSAGFSFFQPLIISLLFVASGLALLAFIFILKKRKTGIVKT